MTTPRTLATLAVAVVGLVASLAVATPAAAAETFPLFQKFGDRGQHTVIVEAPRQAYGLRLVARRVDRRVDNLRIVAHRGADCRRNVTCIKMRVRHYGSSVRCLNVVDPRACAQVGGIDPFIRVNSARRSALNQRIMCHEFLHALGLHHHGRSGCVAGGVTPGDPRYPSRYELRVLDRLF